MNTLRFVRPCLAGIAGSAVAIVVWQLLVPIVARITLNPRYQSADFLAVLSRLVAQHTSKLHLFQFFVFWIVLLGSLHGIVFSVLRPSLPGAGNYKGLSFGVLLWIFGYLFFEFLSPWGQFNEPVLLVMFELLMWLAVALTEGLTIAAVSGSAL
jgi:hypothetical protein